MNRLGVLVMLAGLAACSAPADPRSDDTSGLTQLGLAPTPLISLGGVDERPEYSFSVVGGGMFLDSDRFVILDSHNRDFKVYSTAGEHLRTFGRLGEGPGEIGRVPALIPSSNGLIRVWDGLQHRLTVFDEQGEHLESLHPLSGVDIRFADAAGAFPDHEVVWNQPRESSGSGPAATGEYADTVYHVLRTSDGALDTLATTLDSELFRASVDGQNRTTPVLFGREGFAVVGGDRLVYGVSDEPVLRSKNRDGTDGPTFRWDIERDPISTRESDSVRSQIAAPWRARRDSGGPQLVAFAIAQLEAVESAPVRETRPHFSAVHVNGRGAVLVQQSSDLFAGTHTWVVFDPDGALIGQLTTPREFQVLDFTRERILGYSLDDLDLATIQIREITARLP